MNLSDLERNSYMLRGSLAKRGYMRWWHSFSGIRHDTGETRTFFVEIFVVNPALGGNDPILGQHPYYKKRGVKPSYVMVKAGVFPDEYGNRGRQLHAFYPISALQTTKTPLTMRLEETESGACLCSEDKLCGFVDVTPQEARHRSLMSDAGFMKWDVEVRKAVSCHTGALGGKFFQALRALDSYWHGEGIRSFFSGTVTLDDADYEVVPDLSYGYADKHWGRCFNRPWLQIACGRLSSQRTEGELRHSVLALNGFYSKFLLFRFKPRIMMQLTYRGEDFDFTRCKWEAKETGKRFIWKLVAKSKTAVAKLSGSCTKEEMMRLRYEDPDGKKSRLPLWAGSLGVGTVQIYRKTPGGRELLDTLKLENALCIYRADGPGQTTSGQSDPPPRTAETRIR